MSDVEEVDNAEVEYTEGDDDFINHESIISADRASRMANMISSGIVDPDSGNKVYFENKPPLEVEQFQPDAQANVEEQLQEVAQNEIAEPENEQQHSLSEEKQEVIEEKEKIQILETQLNEPTQANRLGDEILPDSHDEVKESDFKWSSGFNSKTQRKDSQNSHPSEELQVIPSHNKSDISEENHAFVKNHNQSEESHKIEELKPNYDENENHEELSEQKSEIPKSLVELIAEQHKEKIEVVEKAEEHSHPIQILDNNAIQVKSNIKEQQKHEYEVVPVQRQYPEQRILPNKQNQNLIQEKEVIQEAVEQKIVEHHVNRQVTHQVDKSTHKNEQIVSQPQNVRIKDNNLPSAVLPEEVPSPPQQAPIQKKEIKQQKGHHHPKENPFQNNKYNQELPSSKPVHTYQQIEHDREEKKVNNEVTKQNNRPPSIKRQSMHINSVRQKPHVQQSMKKNPKDCTCEIM